MFGRHEFPFGGHFDDEFGPRPAAPNGAFRRQFRGYPVSFIDRSDLEHGDKIVLPPSALDTLTRLNITFPMLFKLTSREGRSTHCGVQEFVAEEGHANLPYWQMQNLLVSEGSMITISNVNLPKGNFVKFQPQSSDFLKISNPKAVLEATLRTFTCLTKGDSIAINYNDRTYYIDVKEVAPGDAISIIETDVNVEFEAPPDYVDPASTSAAQNSATGAQQQQQSNQQQHANSQRNGGPHAAGQSLGSADSGSAAGVQANKMQFGNTESDPSARIKERLERFKKKLPQADDDSSDEDDKPPPKPMFPGSGHTLKQKAGRSSLTIPSSSAAGAAGSGSEDSSAAKDENSGEKKSFVPFGGQGRSLR